MAKPDDEAVSEDERPYDEDSIGMQTGEDAERALGVPEALIGELPEDSGRDAAD
jgi:hypothetical protein